MEGQSPNCAEHSRLTHLLFTSPELKDGPYADLRPRCAAPVCTACVFNIYIHISIYIHVRHRALVARSGVIEGPLLQSWWGGWIDLREPDPSRPRTLAYTCVHLRDFFGPIFRSFFWYRFLIDFSWILEPSWPPKPLQNPSKIQ